MFTRQLEEMATEEDGLARFSASTIAKDGKVMLLTPSDFDEICRALHSTLLSSSQYLISAN